MLEKNSYPTRFHNQQIRIFFNKMHEKVKTPEVEEKPDTETKQDPYSRFYNYRISETCLIKSKQKFGTIYSKNFSKNQNLLWYTKQQLLAKNSGTRTVKLCYTAQE